ncbi:MAG: tetratricopeptide repeat protein, partial [Terriglobales bacterium]
VGRAFTLYLEPLAASGQVNARNYGSDYFMVAAPAGNSLRMDQIRHTYLHFILDPLLLKRANAMLRVAPILKTVQNAPLDEIYKKDVSLLLTESLIRAVEARMMAGGRNAEPVRQREADKAMSEGYVLTRYFYDQLVKFENEPTGLRDALPDWLYYLDVSRETKRAENVRFAPVAAPDVLPASIPKSGLLDLAEQRLDAGDYDGAHKLAEQALDQKTEDAGRALFILARAASLNKDMPGARDYFERTVQVARDPRLRAWAHIYLGRISDIQENRPAALEHYKAALAVAGIPADTRAAAERGLQQPYEPQRP